MAYNVLITGGSRGIGAAAVREFAKAGYNVAFTWHSSASAADAVVLPYRSATQSGVTQIAYNFCTPMIVTDVGGLAEIVPNGKVGYVTSVDARAIADALLDFCQRDPHCFDSGIEEEKRKYAWSNMTAAVTQGA